MNPSHSNWKVDTRLTLVDNQLKHVIETRQTSEPTYRRGNGVLLVLTYQL